ncbi:hypothetical protein J1N35_005544, partial [Gossypium stocksii]
MHPNKRHDQLRDIKASHIAELIDCDIIKFDNLTQRSEADGIYDAMTFIEFVFILHFMNEMLGIIDDLFQALQFKSQDILNMMQLVSSTKTLLQKFREHV